MIRPLPHHPWKTTARWRTLRLLRLGAYLRRHGGALRHAPLRDAILRGRPDHRVKPDLLERPKLSFPDLKTTSNPTLDTGSLPSPPPVLRDLMDLGSRGTWGSFSPAWPS